MELPATDCQPKDNVEVLRFDSKYPCDAGQRGILYQVVSNALNQAVKRIISSFSERFIFQLTKDELE